MEIERKFLVHLQIWESMDKPIGMKIRQGYLSTHPERTVRVRIQNKKAYLTIKGKSHYISREEFEYPIPLEDAEALLVLCRQPLIQKIRYEILYQGKLWEVDVFQGQHQGLVLAELELPAEDTPFAKPDWVAEEVSGKREYYNSYLSEHPGDPSKAGQNLI
jgi:adenylate cyclase